MPDAPPPAAEPARTLAAPAPPVTPAEPPAAPPVAPPITPPVTPQTALPAPPVTRAPPVVTTVRPLEATELPRAPLPEVSLPAVRAPERAPVAVPALPRALGQPDAGARVGAERATPPALAASAPLRLELPAARAPQAGLVNPRVLNLVPPAPERKSPLAEGIEKAARPDCRKAYSGMGALAALPLAADALRDGGCRW
jgi:hypothetical protein